MGGAGPPQFLRPSRRLVTFDEPSAYACAWVRESASSGYATAYAPSLSTRA